MGHNLRGSDDESKSSRAPASIPTIGSSSSIAANIPGLFICATALSAMSAGFKPGFRSRSQAACAKAVSDRYQILSLSFSLFQLEHLRSSIGRLVDGGWQDALYEVLDIPCMLRPGVDGSQSRQIQCRRRSVVDGFQEIDFANC